MIRTIVFAAATFCFAGAAHAEVAATDPGGFSTKHQVQTALSAQQAYDAFFQISRWWSDAHTYSGSARNLSLTRTPGGCWCETMPAGGFVRHMTLEYAAPAGAVRLSGGLGPLAAMGVSAALTVEFGANKGGGATITATYSVSGRTDKSWVEIANAVDGVLGEQFARLAALPPPPPARTPQRTRRR